jgi:hypothetical protein
MKIEQWWPKLSPATRAWLVENNGETLPADLIEQISAVGGDADLEDGVLSDAAIDWVEAAANDEWPSAP